MDEVTKVLNDNQGVLALTIFFVSLFLGWVSGIFESLRGRAKLKISLIGGPTLCSTFPLEEKFGDHQTHRTAISLYLRIANVGHAPTSIEDVSIIYRWGVHPRNPLRFLRKMIWLPAAVVMQDFQIGIGENIKVFPMLLQLSYISGRSTNTYLRAGESVNGVCYFEQTKSWGAFHPYVTRGQTKLRVRVKDAHGSFWTKEVRVPVVPLDEAKKYNPSFGDTLAHLHGEFRHKDDEDSIRGDDGAMS